MSELPYAKVPIGYRVWWEHHSGFRLKKRPPPAHCNFPTREEAESYKQSLKARWGDAIAVCVSPIYIARTKREKRFDERQRSAAADWPFQRRPQQ